jgi:hypothetical protein
MFSIDMQVNSDNRISETTSSIQIIKKSQKDGVVTPYKQDRGKKSVAHLKNVDLRIEIGKYSAMPFRVLNKIVDSAK